MTVTASVLYDLVQCPQRVALDAFGDRANRDEASAFVRLLWERGTLFERETIAKLNRPLTDLSKASDSVRERLTLDAIQLASPARLDRSQKGNRPRNCHGEHFSATDSLSGLTRSFGG